MRALIVSTALALLAALPAHAQWEPVDEVLQVRIQGKGAWSVRCEYQDRRGKTVVREANGRGDRLYLSAYEGSGGSCTYRAAADQPLTIRLKSPLYRCTLPAREKDLCQQTFAAGASGQFQVVKRD